MWLFIRVPWVGLQCVIVVFPDQSHLLLDLCFDSLMRFVNIDNIYAYEKVQEIK